MYFRAVRSIRFAIVVRNVSLLALFLANQFCHSASSPEAAAKVNRRVEVSGIAHTVRQLQPGMVSEINKPQQGVPANVRGALREAATHAFQAGPMIEQMRARLGTVLSVAQLDDTLAWLDSPLGRRITAAENEGAEPAAFAKMQAYARELERRPPPKRRVNLIDELNRATGSSEIAATIMEGAILASALGANAAQPVQQQVPGEVLRQQIKASLPQLRQQSDQMVALSMFYVYRSMSDQEIESYLKFLKSPSGAAYAKGAVEAFRETMLDAFGRFMVAMPKALAKHKDMGKT